MSQGHEAEVECPKCHYKWKISDPVKPLPRKVKCRKCGLSFGLKKTSVSAPSNQ